MDEAEVKNGSRIQQRYRMKQKLGAVEKKSGATEISSGIERSRFSGAAKQKLRTAAEFSSGIG
jgi:hypothetical protein